MTREQPIERTTAGMRAALCDEIDRIRAGNVDIKRANAVAKLCDTVCKTLDVELAYLSRQGPDQPATPGVGDLALCGPADRPALEHQPEEPPIDETPQPGEPVLHARIRACLREKGKADINAICKWLGKGIGGKDREDILRALVCMRTEGVVMMHGANYLLARRA